MGGQNSRVDKAVERIHEAPLKEFEMVFLQVGKGDGLLC
jgi:hypothetical protein